MNQVPNKLSPAELAALRSLREQVRQQQRAARTAAQSAPKPAIQNKPEEK